MATTDVSTSHFAHPLESGGVSIGIAYNHSGHGQDLPFVEIRPKFPLPNATVAELVQALD